MRTFPFVILLPAFVLIGCGVASKNESGSALSSGPQAPPQPARENTALPYRISARDKTLRFESFAALNQVTLAPQPDKLVVTASGSDPSIAFPMVTVPPAARCAVRVDQTVPVDTLVELFYNTTSTPVFTSDHMVSLHVRAGRSVVLFEINDPDFAGGLRFDPGQNAGEYVLYDVEFFSSEPLGLGPKQSLLLPTPTPAP